MIKFLIIFFMLGCTFYTILTIIKNLHLYKSKNNTIHSVQLSKLGPKGFAKHIDYLTEDLY